MAADLTASHLIDFKVFLAPQVGLEPTTLRLTAEGSTLEHVCFQRSSEVPRGEIGASSARNWTKFWTKYFNPARFSIPDRGGAGLTASRWQTAGEVFSGARERERLGSHSTNWETQFRAVVPHIADCRAHLPCPHFLGRIGP